MHTLKMPKCQKCHGVILGYDCHLKDLSLGKVDLSHCAKVQEMQRVSLRKNRVRAARKNPNSHGRARYLPSSSKGSLPMVGYNHHNCCSHCSCCGDCNGYNNSDDNSHYDDCRRRGKAECKDMFRDSFFVEKSSPKPQPCKGRSLFSHCCQRSFMGGASLCLGITRNPKTLHPTPHKTIAPGTMVHHYTECNNINRSEATRKLHR